VTALGYALGVLIGVTLGLLGGGGAILSVPVLVYILAVPVKSAVPTSLVVVGLTSLVGVVRHYRAGHVNVRAALVFAPSAAVGSLVGSRLALLMNSRLQLAIFAVVLLVASVRMFQSVHVEEGAGPAPSRPLPFLMAIGAGVGLLTGLVGVGGGFLYVPALTLLAGLDMKHAVGTSLALITVSCAAGFAGYLGEVQLDWVLIAIFTTLAFAGVIVGSRLAQKVDATKLRKAFAVLMLVMGVLVLVRR
jgi:uncharacterized membrane protein YfcA